MIEVARKDRIKEVINLLLTPEYEKVMTMDHDDWKEPEGGRSGLSMMVKRSRKRGHSYDKIFEEFKDKIVKYFPFVVEKRLFGLDGHPDIDHLAAEEIMLTILDDEDTGIPFYQEAPEEKREDAKELYEMIKAFDEKGGNDSEWYDFYLSIRPRVAYIIGEKCD